LTNPVWSIFAMVLLLLFATGYYIYWIMNLDNE
jgi:hypothetical protein